MMPQQESDPIHEQAESAYGRYEGGQEYARQQFETPYQQPAWAGKIHTAPSDDKNMLRLVALGMVLVALMAFAVICLIIVGGTAGWISFCAACLATFIVAVVAIDKIK